jgi:tetratricopeptide (TPR) repeat protein
MRSRTFCTRCPLLILGAAWVGSWPWAAAGALEAAAESVTAPPTQSANAPASSFPAAGPRGPGSVLVLEALARVHAESRSWTTVVRILGPADTGLDAEGALLLSEGWQRTGQPAAAAAVLERARRRFPSHEGLRLARIDAALSAEQWASALERAREALRELGPSPALHLRAAQAYFGLGNALGAVKVREVADGRPGQFVKSWLLLEQRGPQRFLCCPEASALYQLRRALDGGLDTPEAHLLHARLWQKAGKPRVGLTLLKSREVVLLESGDAATLATFAALALEADALDDYLRYTRLLAAQQPDRRRETLGDAYNAVAERYGQRGEAALYREFSYRALRLRPDDVERLLRVAEAEWSAGRSDAAAALYRRVLELEPTHPRREVILERLAGQPAAEPSAP